MQLQRTIGNRAVGKLLAEIGLIYSKAQASPVQMQAIPEEEEALRGKMADQIIKKGKRSNEGDTPDYDEVDILAWCAQQEVDTSGIKKLSWVVGILELVIGSGGKITG